MKNIVCLLLLAFSTSFLTAQSFTQEKPLLQHLQDLNAQWYLQKNYLAVDASLLQSPMAFKSHEDLIQTHLQLVEQVLVTKDAKNPNRAKGLLILKDYWQAGIFPKNTQHNYLNPYFIDDFNTACAVGHVMRESGSVELASTIAKTHNYAYIHQMPYENELSNWANEMGFEVDELRWIQPAYGPPVTIIPTINEPSCNNADGSISITASPGWTIQDVSNLEYYWDNGDTGMQLNNIAAGRYCVDIQENDFPVMKTCFLVNNDLAMEVTGNVSHETCPDALDGSITLTIPEIYEEVIWYNQLWEPIGSGITIENLDGIGLMVAPSIPIMYNVKVTDFNGCISYGSFGVQETKEAPYISAFNAISLASCNLANGVIEPTVYGGESVVWDNGVTTLRNEFLAPGNHTITATSPDGCESEYTFNLAESCPAICNTNGSYHVKLKFFLEGWMDGNEMKTNLNTSGIMPEQQPFANTIWAYNGEENMNLGIPKAVDWVMVCARNANGNLLQKKSAILLKDGTVVNTDGTECITFDNLNSNGTYYISAHHFGHIGVMSTSALTSGTAYDFSSGANQAMGADQLKPSNDKFVLFGGDFDGNGIINNLDFNLWKSDNSAINIYAEYDADGNGIINNQDYNIWRQNNSKVGFGAAQSTN